MRLTSAAFFMPLSAILILLCPMPGATRSNTSSDVSSVLRLRLFTPTIPGFTDRRNFKFAFVEHLDQDVHACGLTQPE